MLQLKAMSEETMANITLKAKIEVLQLMKFEFLVNVTFKNAEEQLILGSAFFELLIKESSLLHNEECKNQALVLAEKWLALSKDQGNVQAWLTLVNFYIFSNQFTKAENCALEGIKQKIYALYVPLIDLYKQTNKKEKAFATCLEAFSVTNNQLVSPEDLRAIHNDLASFYIDGFGCKKDCKKGIEIYKTTYNAGSVEAGVKLACIYMRREKDIEPNLSYAKKILEQILKKSYAPSEFLEYTTAVGLLGNLYASEGNFKLAEATYKLIEDLSGKIFLANLVLMDKIKGSKEKARQIIEEGAKDGLLPLAGYFWGTLLIIEGNPEKAVAYFEDPTMQCLHIIPLIRLQLAIAYWYGFGAVQNVEKAKEYIALLYGSSTDTQLSLLCKAYTKLIGFGCEKDIPAALKLLDESKQVMPDMFCEVDQLFPNIATILAAHRENVANELLAESEPKKQVKAKKAKKQGRFKINPFTTVDFWNSEEFPVKDKCKVTNVNTQDRIITIDSPDTNETFEIVMDSFKDNARWVKTLIYHSRIKERQGIGASVDEKTKHDHTFPEILDYMIQVGGIEVPFVKNGIMNEQLVARIKRINKTTGQSTVCRLEYAFGENKSGTKYVYHRLARPQ